METRASLQEAEPVPDSSDHRTLESRSGSRFEWSLLALFAILVALLTWRHEMWSDEVQAWLIVRDTHSISQLLHVLHYEGHPALWYLLLWIPAHISWNPVSMQVINYAFAVTLAGLILFAKKLSWPLRILIVFSYFFFYQYAVTARSYGLASLLLIAAALCLIGERQHRKLAILLLALSINTHVFAAPVAVALAFWAFFLVRVKSWSDARRMLVDREFLTAFVVLAVSGVIGLATVWPAKDLPGTYAFQHTFSHDLVTSAGTVWQVFFPHLPGPVQIFLIPFRTSLAATCVASVIVLAVATLLLRTAAARWFFVVCTLMEVVEIAVTVGWPDVWHLGFIFAAFVIAMLMDTYSAPYSSVPRPAPKKFGTALLLAFLLPQTLCAIDVAVLDWNRPYSDGKVVSEWLTSHHLAQNPLVLERPEFSTPIVAYLEIPSAYYPACQCFGSYQLRDARYRLNRSVTPAEMKMVRGNSQLPVIVIIDEPLKPAELKALGLVQIYVAPKDAIDFDSVFHVYEQLHPPA